jgi:hypothetical protein
MQQPIINALRHHGLGGGPGLLEPDGTVGAVLDQSILGWHLAASFVLFTDSFHEERSCGIRE